MSNVFLNKVNGGMMYCKCPKCGEVVYVYESDEHGTLEDGTKEYLVRCDDCGMWFNTSVEY